MAATENSSTATHISDTYELFRIDADSAVPPFQQVHDAVVRAVTSGQLVPGAKLPTTRGLADQLGIAVNTVASAYRRLEASGIVEGRGRAGTFVRLGVGGDPVEEQARSIASEAARALTHLGVDRAQAVRLVDEAYRAIQP